MKDSIVKDGISLSMPRFISENSDKDDSPVKISFDVQSDEGIKQINITERLLSKHILALGSIGSGKTNLINILLSNIIDGMTEDDVVVIFDTKGDFLRKFAKSGDVVFGNLNQLPSGVECAKWNVYKEVLLEPTHTNENLLEICKSLFLERTLHNNNPFFPNAAKDLLYGYMMAKIREGKQDDLNNAALLEYFQSLDIDNLRELLGKHPDLKSCLYYIEGKNLQTQGVISEVVELVRDIFVDKFAQAGNTSIREIVRNKGKKIFVEYDLALGNMLTPIYRLLMDLVIKEALCRDSKRGNVFVIIDEFSLLPNLQHIADGVNFGREQGIKFIVGLQNVEQMYSAYGEYDAGSILSGFNTRFLFKVNDSVSRKYVQELLGTNRMVYSFPSVETQKGMIEQMQISNVLEDWVYDKLPIGCVVFYQAGKNPEIFKLPEYKKNTENVKNSMLKSKTPTVNGFKRIN